MKVLPFKIPKPSNTAIVFQVDSGMLYGQLHQHEEVQISIIKEGKGTLVVADTVHSFEQGDLFILGGKQPHVFYNIDSKAEMHTIFFSPYSFGNSFLDLEEGKGLKDFYTFTKAGLKITATPSITTLFQSIQSAQGLYKLAHFLQLITILNVANSAPLSNIIYTKAFSEVDGKKMQNIYEFSLDHFTSPISLITIAEIATMTPNAFCKYFKKRTQKSYTQFLTELRIAHACKLLKESPEMPIAIVAENSGFQTLSHFNRKFRHYKNRTPREYRLLR